MTHTTTTTGTPSVSTAGDGRGRAMKWGAIATAAAIAVSVICVYGDSTLSASQQASQENALPWIIGAIVVLAGLVFALAVPRLRRSPHLSGWALAAGIVGLAGFPVYWSGLSVVFGGAAVLLGLAGRHVAAGNGNSARLATAAVVLGVLAAGADVIVALVTTYF